jgi:hypothetical protein
MLNVILSLLLSEKKRYNLKELTKSYPAKIFTHFFNHTIYFARAVKKEKNFARIILFILFSVPLFLLSISLKDNLIVDKIFLRRSKYEKYV